MKTFIVFDLEATCYERNNKPEGFKNEIIEIGAYKVDSDGNIIDDFSKFVKPKTHPLISDFCEKLTTITQEDINNAEPTEKVLKEFFEWAEDSMFISWGHYDKFQLKFDLKQNNLDPNVINDKNHRSLKHDWAKFNKRRTCGLSRALKVENFKFEGTAHRGIDDAKNIIKIFKKYINNYV